MEIVFLLTACVNPQRITQLVVADETERLNQYLDALRFYLEKTIYRIVFVDNSNFDLSTFFLDHVAKNRIEFLRFDGNTYNVTLGKGYGEALILEYAFLNSTFLKEADFVVKITGRLKIMNVSALIDKSVKDKHTVSVDVDLKLHYAQSQFFVIPLDFYYTCFRIKMFAINDTEGVHFEHILAQSIKEWIYNRNRLYIFSNAVCISGVSGSTGVVYSKPSIKIKVAKYIKSMLWHLINKGFNVKSL
ncbi:MAG: hypothetical protein H6Q14_1457 [Bacteroidetes bacterium]|nr:hypothetical protein [Bacteroidota bacterium]